MDETRLNESSPLPFKLLEPPRKINSGQTSHNYVLVTEKSTLIMEKPMNPLLIDPGRKPCSLEDEHERLTLLHGKGALVPKSLGLVETEEFGKVLIKEFIEGSNIDEIMYKDFYFTVEQVKQILVELVKTLKIFEDEGLYPSDLAAENIILRHQDDTFTPYLVDVKEMSTNPKDKDTVISQLRNSILSVLLSKIRDEDQLSPGLNELNSLDAQIVSGEIDSLDRLKSNL